MPHRHGYLTLNDYQESIFIQESCRNTLQIRCAKVTYTVNHHCMAKRENLFLPAVNARMKKLFLMKLKPWEESIPFHFLGEVLNIRDDNIFLDEVFLNVVNTDLNFKVSSKIVQVSPMIPVTSFLFTMMYGCIWKDLVNDVVIVGGFALGN